MASSSTGTDKNVDVDFDINGCSISDFKIFNIVDDLRRARDRGRDRNGFMPNDIDLLQSLEPGPNHCYLIDSYHESERDPSLLALAAPHTFSWEEFGAAIFGSEDDEQKSTVAGADDGDVEVDVSVKYEPETEPEPVVPMPMDLETDSFNQGPQNQPSTSASIKQEHVKVKVEVLAPDVDQNQSEMHMDPFAMAMAMTPEKQETPGPSSSSTSKVINDRSRSAKKVKVKEKGGEPPALGECPICEDMFPVDSLYAHKTSHIMICHICGHDQLRINEDFVKHCLTHIPPRNNSCELCGHKARSKGKLLVHSNGHYGVNPMICLDCGVGFADKRAVVMHQREGHFDSLKKIKEEPVDK